MIKARENELEYEQLTLIIDAFEKAALESGTREGYLVVASSPLTGMDSMLDAGSTMLKQVGSTRTTEGSGADTSNQVGVTQESMFGIDYDEDLAELFGENNPAANYVQECLNCNLRLQFDWQLKPVNLLGGLDKLIDQVNLILDGLELQLDPLAKLEDICNILNLLKGLCIPDLIIVLISLKLLIKRYVTEALNINLDWTVVLGPLLNAIVGGIASLLEQLAGVILAPLDCSLNALITANTLEKESRQLLQQVDVFAQSKASTIKSLSRGELPADTNIAGVTEEFRWTPASPGTYPEAPQFGGFNSTQTPLNTSKDAFSIKKGEKQREEFKMTAATGFQFNQGTTLSNALKDANFPQSTMVEKLILPLQDAKLYINDLLSNLLKSLRSVQSLVSGGMNNQVGTIAILLYLKDMISLVMMIINLLKSNQDVSDWCSHLESNPNILQEAIRSRFGRAGQNLTVDNGDDNTLILRTGPDILMEIKTCASSRTTPEAELLQQWIQDLKRQDPS